MTLRSSILVVAFIAFLAVGAVVPVTYSPDTDSFARNAGDAKNDNDKKKDKPF